MALSRIKRIALFLVPVSIAVCVLLLNMVVISSSILVPTESDSCYLGMKVIEYPHVVFIYGSSRLDHGVLCYMIALHKLWDSDPAHTLLLSTYIVNYTAPWYVRGYSIKASNISVSIEGLPLYIAAWPIPRERVSVDRDAYTLEIETYVSGYIAREYNATLHIAIKITITEWSILGPVKTYEIPILNKTIPITIEIKRVYPEAYPWLVQQSGQ